MLYNTFEAFQKNFSQIDSTSKLYINVGRSFDDIASATIYGDVSMLTIGFSMVYVYVMIQLGKFNCLEARVRVHNSIVTKSVISPYTFTHEITMK